MNRSLVIAAIIAVGAVGWVASGLFGGPDEQSTYDNGAATASIDTDSSKQADVPTPPSVRVLSSRATVTPRVVRVFGRTEADRAVTLRAETAAPVREVIAEEGAKLTEGDHVLRLAIEDRQSLLDEARNELAYREIAFSAADELSKKQFSSEVKLAEERAALARARAEVAAAQLDIEHTRVKAPFDGVVDQIEVEVGDVVDVNDPLAYLVDLNPIVVVVGVSERDVASIEVGNLAAVRIVGREETVGIVRFVSRSGEDETRTFKVEIAVENVDYEIAEGLTAEVFLESENQTAHKISPAALTLDDEGRLGVMTVTDRETAEFVPVKIVRDEVDGIWITGLGERATIIVTGQEYVTDGQRVAAVSVE